jgi:hypothetical protein
MNTLQLTQNFLMLLRIHVLQITLQPKQLSVSLQVHNTGTSGKAALGLKEFPCTDSAPQHFRSQLAFIRISAALTFLLCACAA